MKKNFSLIIKCTIVACSLLAISCSNSSSDDNNGITPVDSSAYITKVYEYVYAPGQHASLAKPSDIYNFTGIPSADKWLYLGGFGGYVIAGFDHDVQNGAGADFEVFALAGSAPEPAIVYVMPDTNDDGLPNDTWYELKGNCYNESKKNYWVKYFKPASETGNITWADSEGNSGELIPGYGATCSASWWWSGTTSDNITFSGTRLPDSYINKGTDTSQYWVVPDTLFQWGYAENMLGSDYVKTLNANKLDISNAVDGNGKGVSLSSIRFIKVQTAVFQQAGWCNEVSAEVRGAKDLSRE